MMRPPRIRLVVLLEDLEFGGTQRYAMHLLQRLDRNWFAPEVWVLRGGDDLLPPMQAAGVKVVYLSRGRYVGPRALANLTMHLRHHRPDILYTLTALPNIWGRLLAGLMRIPVVSGYRSLMPNQHERLLSRFSARIIANAEAVKERMAGRLGIAPDQVTVIPNGVDTGVFTPDAACRSAMPLVVCVARMVGEKDIPTLLEAFRIAGTQVPAAEFAIIGNGPLALAPQAGVRFLPATDDIRALLRRAWVFALASRSEASPNVVLEAMACGLPVVATRVGGIPELVVEEKTGLLAPVGDPAALAAALVRLLKDDVTRKSMGDAGRQRALRDFPVTRMVTRTEQVLREVAQLGSRWTVTETGEVPLEVPLWPDLALSAGPAEALVERGRYRPDRSLQNVTVPTLTLYRPPPDRANGSTVAICPGGGYAALSIDKEGHDVARWFAARGVTGLVLKYRLPRVDSTGTDTPWPLQDIMQAVRLAREHADEWGIDPRRLGVMGFSAGGHMAAAASSMDRELAFAVLVYPVISMAPELTHKGSRLRLIGARPAPGLAERYSYERHADARTCPTLLVHARDDDVAKVGNSLVYAEALSGAGVAHELLLYEKAGHGFGLGLKAGVSPPWSERCLAWLSAASIMPEPR
jgi:glycosyltransferase involved in cell wall biosynthesis/acetyl esterase/lipase